MTQESSPSLSRRIFAEMTLFSMGAVAFVAMALIVVFYMTYEHDAERRLAVQAGEAALFVNALPGSFSEGMAFDGRELLADDDSIRVSLIAPDGRVLFDSLADAGSLPSHADRPEVIEALEFGQSSANRVSSTLGVDTIYAAVRLDDGKVLRLAENRRSLAAFVGGMVVPLIVAILAVVAAALPLSRILTRRIMAPINRIDPAEPFREESYQEMAPLLVRVRDQQAQLKEQNGLLSRRDDMRREFSANVSHEMKSPLQVISGYAELMRDGVAPIERHAEFSGKIFDEAQSMRRLVDDVLMLSRLDEPSLSGASMAPTELLSLAGSVARRIEEVASRREVSIVVEGSRCVLDASARLVEEAVQNLLENAVRYNKRPGRVVLRVMDRRPEQGQAIIEVEDTGTGIPLEALGHVFERFYRVEKSRSKDTGGTGLGLAIVKHVAELHGGFVEVESVLGKGSTFRMVLPAAMQAGQGDAS